MLRHRMFLALAHATSEDVSCGVGVGWGGDDDVPCACTHVRCYTIGCFLHLHTYLMLRVKRRLRRVNKVGRLAPSKSHVDPLAMQRPLDKPGLETVLEAMQFYRSKRMGHVGWSPAAFGILKDDNSWLHL